MKFTIKDRITTAEPNAVLSYALDYRAEFEVDDEWADKVITARFVHSNGEYIDVVLDDFGCNIPLFPKGVLWVGAYTDAFTSTAVPVPIGVTVKDLGEHEAIPPTADVYQQIIALIEAGRLKGDKGDPGEDYVITESDYQAIADRVPQPDLSDYVKNTDYATASKGGAIKSGYGLNVETNGVVNCAYARTPQQYDNYSNYNFISKGTLENVLAERLKEPQFELIEDITLTEDVASIVRSTEPNGKAYNFKKVCAELYSPQGTKTFQGAITCYCDNKSQTLYLNSFFTTSNRYCSAMFDCTNGLLISTLANPSNSNANTNISALAHMGKVVDSNITQITVKSNTSVDDMPIGTTIKIYGIRG